MEREDFDKFSALVQKRQITIGNLKVSVQASEYHYCAPRVSGLLWDEYTSYEVAVFLADSESKIFLRPYQFGLPQYEEYFTEYDAGIAPCMPKDVVKSFLRDIAWSYFSAL